MDENEVRKFAEAHGQNVVKGDQAELLQDIVMEAFPAMAPVAGALPQPVEGSELKSVNVEGDQATVHIAYTGGDKSVTVESTWEQRDGRPRIVAATIV